MFVSFSMPLIPVLRSLADLCEFDTNLVNRAVLGQLGLQKETLSQEAKKKKKN